MAEDKKSMKEWQEIISRVDVFSGLGNKEKEGLLLNAEEKEIKRKELICNAHSAADHMYVITRGVAKTVRNGDDSQRLLVDFLKPGDVLGEEAVLLSGEYELDIIPVENCSVLCIPVENVRKILESQPRMGKAIAALSATRARAYRERLYMMTAVPVQARLAASLHMLARRFGKKDKQGTLISMRITHQDLADYIGAARETITLFLSRFKKQGLIVMNVRKIIVPDLKALKKAAK